MAFKMADESQSGAVSSELLFDFDKHCQVMLVDRVLQCDEANRSDETDKCVGRISEHSVDMNLVGANGSKRKNDYYMTEDCADSSESSDRYRIESLSFAIFLGRASVF